jgi:hypothetical protein
MYTLPNTRRLERIEAQLGVLSQQKHGMLLRSCFGIFFIFSQFVKKMMFRRIVKTKYYRHTTRETDRDRKRKRARRVKKVEQHCHQKEEIPQRTQ